MSPFRTCFKVLLLAALILSPASLLAQLPSADWQTIETEHFRLYFPRPFEQWARLAATRLEQTRPQLISAVHFEPGGKVDVLIMDPVSDSNGFAWPFLGKPRLVLWTTPPDPESGLGTFSSWMDLLVVHEQGHLVHLLRPSRNPLQRVIEKALPVGPIGLKAPRWVTEGYATLLEGRLTGSGRPNSAFRTAVLRIWAQSGRLPSYSELSSDSESWMGMSMAYLVGSSYLEWLEKRAGPNSLPDLWARLTAREQRSFRDAFRGVFRGAPKELYERYSAELTHESIESERARGPLIEGSLWQDLDWTTEPPQVSPDGLSLLTVLRHRREPDRLVVLGLAENPAQIARVERARSTQDRDPLDVASVDDGPVKREPLYELYSPDRRRLMSPRWMPDGTILLAKDEPDARGILRPDLFRWTPGTDRPVRLTREAGIADADPSPDGKSVYGVRNRFGTSQLIRIALDDRAIEELSAPDVDVVYDYPRLSPDGGELVYLKHVAGSWQLAKLDLVGEGETMLLSTGETLAQPAWSRDGEWIYLSVGSEGFFDIQRLRPDGTGREIVTRSRGGSFAPAIASDGKTLYFLSLDPDGLDIRVLDVGVSTPTPPPLESAPPRPESSPQKPASLKSGPYGTGRQEWSILIGGTLAPASRTLELGGRVGDVVGRLDALLAASFGDEKGFSGAAAAASWRGWPVTVSSHVFKAEENGSFVDEQTRSRAGIELRTEGRRHFGAHLLDVSFGGLYQRFGESETTESSQQKIIFSEVRLHGEHFRRRWQFPYDAEVRGFIGESGDDTWDRLRIAASWGLQRSSNSLRLRWARNSTGSAPVRERLTVGGMPSTIIPESALSARVHVPALEPGTLIGEAHELQGLDLRLSGSPISLFAERHRTSGVGQPAGEWLELAGLRFEYSGPSFPLLQLPGFEINAGVAHVLSTSLQGNTEWWLGLAWRP